MSNPVLILNNVTKVYRGNKRAQEVIAVNGVSFTLKAGRVLGIVGESGSGKTTIGRLVTQIEAPSSGKIEFVSHSGNRMGKMSKVQMVFQDPYAALNPFNTVQYAIMRPLINHLRLSRNAALEKARELLETVHLTPSEEFLPKRPNELSGGQRQRVVIARALAAQPDIIIADEPTSMLDVSIRADIISLLDDLRSSGRVRGLLYITHDLLSARFLADDLLVLFKGKSMEYGPTKEVLNNPKNPYTKVLWDALPNPHKKHEVSSLVAASTKDEVPLEGCPFFSRCPYTIAKCRTQSPPLLTQPDGRQIACHVVNDNMKEELNGGSLL